jgi:anthranilate phosphoribosyltransferase
MLKEYIKKLIAKQDLTAKECELAAEAILETDIDSRIAAFLVLLRAKGETADEIFGIASAMRSHMRKIHTNYPVLDIVGTGGDGANTVNISTGASILAASCGVKIAKHGNRAVSSQCGSADVLEALGVKIDLPPEKVIACINKIGIGFCFAPIFHPAFAKLKDIRRNLGIPTCFNLLGPLLNPASAEHLLIGVNNNNLVNLFAEVLLKLKVKHALVFHGAGIDELSCLGATDALEITHGKIKQLIIDPQQLGFTKCRLQDLQGGSPQLNAQLLKQVFAGQQNAIADTLILNAAVALYICGKTESIAAAIPLVKKNINNLNTQKTLENLIENSHE